MRDINDEEFQVGDSLKVVKYADSGVDVQVGDVVQCVIDDGSSICRFKNLRTNKTFFYYNNHLQKL